MQTGWEEVKYSTEVHSTVERLRSLPLPLNILFIAGHLILTQVLALLSHNLLKLDWRVLLLGTLEDSACPAIGKISNAVPVTLHNVVGIRALGTACVNAVAYSSQGQWP